MNTFYSHGKLLLTGEYVVLDGAIGLAIPTKKGQSLTVKPSDKKGIYWKSLDENGNVWFEATFELNTIVSENENGILFQLIHILKEAQKLNPSFLKTINIEVTTSLEFPRNWGLGTSSTLINNIAQWANIDAHTLLKNSFGGSGYDVAVAQYKTPILYQLNIGTPKVTSVKLNWNFTNELFFVHLNQKQDSKEGIARYKKKVIAKNVIEEISDLSKALLNSETLTEFEALINKHEDIIAKNLELPTIKQQLFKEYPKTIKSLGAWGGDFILVVGNEQDKTYFKEKGYSTIIPFYKMIL